MDLRRLRAGEWIAAASGALLLVALFVPWYRHRLEIPQAELISDGIPDPSGFEALTLGDAVLAGIGLAAVGLFLVTATQRTVAVPIAHASLFTLVSIVGLVIVVAHLGAEPDPSQPLPQETAGFVQTKTGPGVYMALVAAIGCLVGGLLAMRDERLSRPGRSTDSTGRPGPPPEIEKLPTPPAETVR